MLQLIERFEAEDPGCGGTVILSSIPSAGRRFSSRVTFTNLLPPATRPATRAVTMVRWNVFSVATTFIRRAIALSQAELKQKATAAAMPIRRCGYAISVCMDSVMRFCFLPLINCNHRWIFAMRSSDDWSRSSCYGGVFMENVSNSANEKKNFSPTDYHAPCNQLADQYRRECYIMQTSRMMEMGLSTGSECSRSAQKLEPIECLARNPSGATFPTKRAWENPAPSPQKCELAEDDNRLACMRGAVYALVDNTWDGRYAMPFCAAFGSNTDREDCFKMSIQYLRSVFEKPIEDIAQDCSQHAANSPRCSELAVRPQTSSGF